MPTLKLNKGMEPSDRVGAILVGAGQSQRMGGTNKVFAPLLGQPLLSWPIEVFQSSPLVHQIVLVLGRGSLIKGRHMARVKGWSKVTVCLGGERRQDSVSEGLKTLVSCSWVIVHDVARPCVSPQLLERGLEEARETGAAVAAVPVVDTTKVVEDSYVRETLDRKRLWSVQTPQVFRFDLLQRAHQAAEEEATDDSMLVERLGRPVKVFLGSYSNLKVTTPEDLALAETVLRGRQCPDAVPSMDSGRRLSLSKEPVEGMSAPCASA